MQDSVVYRKLCYFKFVLEKQLALGEELLNEPSINCRILNYVSHNQKTLMIMRRKTMKTIATLRRKGVA